MHLFCSFNFYNKKYSTLKVIFIISLVFYGKQVDKLIAPLFECPLVSIIIPVHNKFRYTYHLLNSILNINITIPYEIIIADDMSNDETKIIEQYTKNIVILHNDKKYNFLLNCNKASKFAKGKYILFLNNDSKVYNGWLNSLVKLIESNDKIGMVGSKLIFPDGRLQEAGGIVFNDGKCSNFGRYDYSDKPEYNYVKEVDLYFRGININPKINMGKNWWL